MFCDSADFILFDELARAERQLIQPALICESLRCFAIFETKSFKEKQFSKRMILQFTHQRKQTALQFAMH